MEKIRVEALTLSLDGRMLLDNLHFTLSQGESLLIIGESGSGKTLLSKMLIGHSPKASEWTGKIYYEGELLSNHQWQQLRGRTFAYMAQNPMAMFNPFRKIRYHFLETIQSHSQLSKQACEQEAVSQMKKLRLGHANQLLDKYPFELSGGMLQRVMLAILLCLQPEVIIMDEPTSALDAYNRDNMARILKNLQEEGKTLLSITHDYDLARELGGQVLVMNKGKIVETGEATSLFLNPQQSYTKELLLGNPYQRLVN